MKGSRPWTPELLARGEKDGPKVKAAFAEAFSK
jgi:hypothetical protein